MAKIISNTNVEIEDGIYDGLWSAYSLDILSETTGVLLCRIKTIDGVKGINCPVKLIIINGNVREY